MSRWYPRRRTLSRKPENVKRRLTNRVFNILAALVIAGGYFVWNNYISPAGRQDDAAAIAPSPQTTTAQTAPTTTSRNVPAASGSLDELIDAQRGGEMVTVTATVARLLADDKDGAAHQKFLLELPTGKRVLVAHNIDLAPRVDGLHKGATVTVRGEFEWNERGGVIHWTHHDPAARHQGGWIAFDGRKYE